MLSCRNAFIMVGRVLSLSLHLLITAVLALLLLLPAECMQVPFHAAAASCAAARNPQIWAPYTAAVTLLRCLLQHALGSGLFVHTVSVTAQHTTSSTLAVSMLQQLQDAGLMQQLPDMLWDAADAVNLATAPDSTREPNVLLKMADDLLEISERVVLLHRGLREVLQARAVLAPPTCGLIHTAMRLFSGHLPTLQHRQQQHDPHQQHQHQQQPVFCSVCQRLADTECMQQAASVESSAKEMVLDLENAFMPHAFFGPGVGHLLV